MPDAREHPIRLRYSHVGTQPPVYIAASFTSPPWDPFEMDSAPAPSVGTGQDGGNELEFFKDFYVAEGHWQYKFRLGPGDWWVCDETVTTEMDDAGNYNNLLVVEPPLTPDPPEEKRAHVRPLAKDKRGDIHDTTWEASSGVDSQEATAAETVNGLKPLVVPSLDRAERTESSTDAQDHEVSGSTKSVTDDPDSTSEPAANEPSPLFAHECLTPEHEEAEVYLHDPGEAGTGLEEETQMLDDCELEMFPTDREHILQRILSTKVSLDEDQTSPDGIPSPASVPPQVSVDPLPAPGQSSPRLGSIEEEDMSNTAVPPPLDVSEPVQPEQGPEASRRVPVSSEATEAILPEESPSFDHSSLREDQGHPVDARTQVLDPGLATLGPRHPTIEQNPNAQTETSYTSPGVDGAADPILVDSLPSKLPSQTSAASKSPVVKRRQSVPGSLEEPEEDVDRLFHFQKKTVEDSRSSSGEGETVIEGSRAENDRVHRPATPSTVGVGSGRKYETLLQALWRIIMVEWIGAILARLFWKSGERK